MSRKVFISSDISVDDRIEDVAEKNPLSALLWPWLLTYFDDWGRAEASPKRIKNSVFPSDHLSGLVTVDLIEESLTFFHSVGLITLYHVNNKRYMMIDSDTWFKYQTHIRKEKRVTDNSKHPAPVDVNVAQVRADARECAQISDNLTNCIPSPSPSPSFNTTTTESVDEIHMKVFGRAIFSPLMTELIQDIKSKGYTDAFVRELMLEAGESGNNPSVRFMKTIFERWDREKIYTRAEAKQRKNKVINHPVTDRDREAYHQERLARERENAEPIQYEPDPILKERLASGN